MKKKNGQKWQEECLRSGETLILSFSMQKQKQKVMKKISINVFIKIYNTYNCSLIQVSI